MNQFLKTLFTASFIISLWHLPIYAQNECATRITSQQINYMNNPYIDRDAVDITQHIQDTINIPVVAHIVGTPDGNSTLSDQDIDKAINTLNIGFAGTGFYFERCILNNEEDEEDDLSSSETVHFSINPQSGNEYALFAEIAKKRALNIFFTPEAIDLNGNSVCGWASFPGEYRESEKNWIVIKNECALNGSTLIHEVGHFFNLYHTHQGKNITLGITEEELVEQTACGVGMGDELCDTPAEPYRGGRGILGIVNEDCSILCDYQDITGASYDIAEDGTSYNFMSYAPADCRNHFTDNQIERMKISYLIDRNYIANYCPNNKPVTNVCNEEEQRKVLIRLSVQMNAPFSNDINNWPGVTFSNTTNCVTYIDWNDKGLTGSIPYDIEELQHLGTLILSNNEICGTIPNTIGQLKNLSQLHLSGNQITGSIPKELGDMKELTYVNLSNNEMCGYIPRQLSNLNKLERFYVHTNHFNECIHEDLQSLCPQLSATSYNFCDNDNICTKCNKDDWNAVKAIYNQLSSPTSSIQSLSYLFPNQPNPPNYNADPPADCNLKSTDFLELNEYGRVDQIWMHSSGLSGTLPPQIGNLKDLKQLIMNDNDLTGYLPASLGNLTKLKHLGVQLNNLSSGLPVNMTKLCGKAHVALDNNENIHPNLYYDFCAGKGGYLVDGNNDIADYIMPGDFNNDKKVNYIDLIYWRNANNKTGPLRDDAHIAWLPQIGDDWNETTFGVNQKHQDANGDGIIDKADLEAFQINFGRGSDVDHDIQADFNQEFTLGLIGDGAIGFDITIKNTEGTTENVDALLFTIDMGDVIYSDLYFDYADTTPIAEEIQRVEGSSEVQIALAWSPGSPPPIGDPFGRMIISVDNDIGDGELLVSIDNIQISSGVNISNPTDSFNFDLGSKNNEDNTCGNDDIIWGSLNYSYDYYAPSSIQSPAPPVANEPPLPLEEQYAYISGCTRVTFNSGGSIELNPGFKNQHGTVFCAQIVECAAVKTSALVQQSDLSVFPNPASGQTTIVFDLAEAGTVSLNITDMTGKHITTLLDGTTKEKGKHTVQYNTNDLHTGVYYCTLKHNENLSTQKLIIVK